MNDNVKSIDELMEYLNSKGIETKEDDRQDLINYGYFHGYKGYRFYKDSYNLLPITSFKQIKTLIELDTNLKALFYDKIMFIETSLKNITLNVILDKIKSENINDLYKIIANSYTNKNNQYENIQKESVKKSLLKLKSLVNLKILNEYENGNTKIKHFYKSADFSCIPIWALFEILTLGDFGFLLKTLNYDLRNEISNKLNITKNFDTNRSLIVNYIYLLRNLRNSVAHNSIIYDCRFKTTQVSNSMNKFLAFSFDVPFVNFNNIIDYVILLTHFLITLGTSKSEMQIFINNFDKIINNFDKSISNDISSFIINKNYYFKLLKIKKYVEKNTNL